jgi:hypothetical protein
MSKVIFLALLGSLGHSKTFSLRLLAVSLHKIFEDLSYYYPIAKSVLRHLVFNKITSNG